MPSSLTHHWFASQQLDHIPIDYRPSSPMEIEAYLVGAQGPDPLFFYGYVPWRKRTNKAEVNAFGSRLHQEEIAEKFERMLLFLQTKDQRTEVRILRAFLLGAMSHYVLDRNVHPYVFYRSGFSAQDPKRYEIYHAQYETMIDVFLLKHFRISPRKHPAKKAIQASHHAMWWVSQMYGDEETEAQNDWYYEAWRDMLTVEKVLYDPWGIKRTLLRWLGKQHTQLYAMMHPCGSLDKDHHDYLNTAHEQWRHPGNGLFAQTSIWDLVEQASEELSQGVLILIKYFENQDASDELQSFCSQIDYSGLKPTETMQYHDSHYDKYSVVL